jgi:hypothetical protein
MEANSAPVMDLDTHSYAQIKSFWARDSKWLQMPAGPDGFPVNGLHFPFGKGVDKFKGW